MHQTNSHGILNLFIADMPSGRSAGKQRLGYVKVICYSNQRFEMCWVPTMPNDAVLYEDGPEGLENKLADMYHTLQEIG